MVASEANSSEGSESARSPSSKRRTQGREFARWSSVIIIAFDGAHDPVEGIELGNAVTTQGSSGVRHSSSKSLLANSLEFLDSVATGRSALDAT